MMDSMKGNAKRQLLKLATLATAGVALSGCTYDLGLGYASDGYGSGYYDCDPYSPFDSYYDCDNGYGFSNIGYGGGWYDSYWYPGYGFYLFDNYGRRHAMRDNHRRYWGDRRHRWYREHRGHDGRRGRGRGYGGGSAPDTMGWPEQDRNSDRRGDGRRGRNDGWRGGDGNGAGAIPTPNPDNVRGGGNNGRGEGRGRGRWRDNDGSGAVPQPGRAERRGGGGNEGRGNGSQNNGSQGDWRQPAPPPSSGQGDPPVNRPAPQPRETPRQEAPRQRVSEGDVERPD